MKKLNSFAMVLSKVLEVFHLIGCVIMIALLITSVTAKSFVSDLIAKSIGDGNQDLTTYGFSVGVIDQNGKVIMPAVIIFAIGGILVMAMMTMVFRNVYLSIRTSAGKTWFAKGETPFQDDVTRMVREIGIFYIMIVIVELILSIIGRLVIGVDAAEISVDGAGVITGIIIICLSQVFSYGQKLQNDVDGLV